MISLISSLAPVYPATSENFVLGRSASNTLARDRPTPRVPCRAPAAPRDIRRNSQITKISGASRISQYSSSVLSPASCARRVDALTPVRA